MVVVVVVLVMVGELGLTPSFFCCCCSQLFETRRQRNQTPSNCPFLRHPAAPIPRPFVYTIWRNKQKPHTHTRRRRRRRLSGAVLHTIAFLLGRLCSAASSSPPGLEDLLEKTSQKGRRQKTKTPPAHFPASTRIDDL